MRTSSLIQPFTTAALLLCFLLGHSTATSVDTLLVQIRQQTQQKEAHVGLNRNAISEQQWESFSEAVAMLDQFQRFVLQEKARFELATATASEACLESIPRSLQAIITEADNDIWTCVGHMATYGQQEVENGEQQFDVFQQIAALHPVNATKDLFLSAWYTEEGRAGMESHLAEQMLEWDNVRAVEMFEVRKRVQEEFEWLTSAAWLACTRYGQQHIAEMFEQGHQHLETCAAA